MTRNSIIAQHLTVTVRLVARHAPPITTFTSIKTMAKHLSSGKGAWCERSDNCLTWEGDNEYKWCKTCSDGYFRSGDGVCYDQQQHHCKKWTKGKKTGCDVCEPNYYRYVNKDDDGSSGKGAWCVRKRQLSHMGRRQRIQVVPNVQ